MEYRGCPLLGGSLSINAMLNSIRVIDFVCCTEVVCFSECPLWEVPLYMLNGFISDSLTVVYLFLMLKLRSEKSA